jgi:hypothetical protein
VSNISELLHVLNSIILFVSFFFHCYCGNITETQFLAIIVVSMALGYALFLAVNQETSDAMTTAKTVAILVGTLWILVPIMSTINKNYATDTLTIMILF